MTNHPSVLRIVLISAAALLLAHAGESGTTLHQRALLDQYCVTCHNARQKTAGLVLEQSAVDVQHVSEHADIWEKVVRKLRAGAMPPANAPRPDKTTYEQFASWLQEELDRAAAATPNPGRTVAFHRLNRTEYQNAIRDVLGVSGIDMALLLPADDVSYGFDNIGGVLKLSSTLLERYLSAARKVSRIAIGDATLPPEGVTYRTKGDLNQWDRLENLPPGTRGGMSQSHYFPVSGEYTLKVEFDGARFEFRPSDNLPDSVEVAIDDERVLLSTLSLETPPEINNDFRTETIAVRVPVRAGLRRISATFPTITSAELEGIVQPYLKPEPFGARMPMVLAVNITGPFQPTGDVATPSRRQVFTCTPATAPEEAPCARRILSTLARRAYRRAVTAADLHELMTFYEAGRRTQGFEQAVGRGIERMLVSPSFLFRVERDPARVAPDTTYRISDLELASRLSFFLWSSVPDDALLKVAAEGRLHNPAVLKAQVARMLASSKADALVQNFTGQWLQLRNLEGSLPNAVTFPDFNDNLRQAMRRETELLFASILREGRSTLDLLTSDYTFVNERLARHYGIPNIYGTYFRRVKIADPSRRGLLGQGSILTITSYATRTSPVVRGKWILDNLLGAAPPPPPPNVPTLQEKNDAGEALSMREAMTRHRRNPACASCHAQMDPLGFALENFDAIGRWREVSEANTPIDASGALPNGTKFEGVSGLREMLAIQPERFVGTVTEKLMTYALGRGVEYYDMPALRAIVRDAAREQYTLSALVLGVVQSVPFQMRKVQ